MRRVDVDKYCAQTTQSSMPNGLCRCNCQCMRKLIKGGFSGRLEPELEMRIDELARYLEVPCKVVSIVCTRKERNLVIANRIRKLSSTKGEYLRQRCREDDDE